MASSGNGQDEPNSALWLVTRADKIELSCWLGITRCPAEKNCSLSTTQILNPLLTKVVLSRWLDSCLVLFSAFIDLDSVTVHKRAKQRSRSWSSHLELAIIFIFILSSFSRALFVHVKMEAVAWINVTETANVSVRKGVNTFFQQKYYVRNTTKTINL